MRIAGGKLKGLVFKTPARIRPTEDKVKKSLFDILRPSLQGASFLDLFAGSGAIGLEALSLGATRVVLVENDRPAVKVLKENLDLIKKISDADISFIDKDVFAAIELFYRQKEEFDFIFLDPPYYKEVASPVRGKVSEIPDGRLWRPASNGAKKTLNKLAGCDILTPSGQVIVQHYKKENLAENIGNLTINRQVKYGETILSFYFK